MHLVREACGAGQEYVTRVLGPDGVLIVLPGGDEEAHQQQQQQQQQHRKRQAVLIQLLQGPLIDAPDAMVKE